MKKATKLFSRAIIIPLVFGIFLSACNKDEIVDEGFCAEENFLGTFDLAPSSLSWFPYAGVEEVVFRDEAGTKVTFKVKGLDTAYNTGYSFNGHCPEKIEESVFYQYDRNTIYQYLQNESLNIELGFTLAPKVSTINYDQYYDVLDLTIDQINSSFYNNSGVIIVSFRNTSELHIPNHFTYLSDHTLLNEAFEEVFSKQNDANTIYVNKEFGFIGFTDSDEKLWVFESMN